MFSGYQKKADFLEVSFAASLCIIPMIPSFGNKLLKLLESSKPHVPSASDSPPRLLSPSLRDKDSASSCCGFIVGKFSRYLTTASCCTILP